MNRRHLLLALLLPTPALAQSLGAPSAPAVTLPPLPPIRLARGVTELPPGAWRVAFPPERDALDAEQRAALGRLGAALQTGSIGRVTLNAEATTGEDVSTHRRLSLARARTVKDALVAGGLDETRVDIRALGRTENMRDTVDVLSPTAPRAP
ncbi:MAG: OmpA family protein [Roseococcus sp.]